MPREVPWAEAWRYHPSVRRVGLALSIAGALVADFPWIALQDHTHWAHVLWIPFVSPPVRPLDCLLNVLLFAPVGVFASPAGAALKSAVARALAIALPVAFAGEATQLFSHGRFPSATDLACNLVGAAVGAFAVRATARRSLQAPETRRKAR